MILSLVYLRNQILKGNDAKRKADIHKIQIAVEEYEKDNDCYPPSLIDCRISTKGEIPDFESYISKFPCDPTTGVGYVYYVDPSLFCPAWYQVYTNLQNEADPDINCEDYVFNYYTSSPNAPDPDCAGSGIPPQGYYGCFSGTCLPINWSSERPGPECDPNYTSSTCCIGEQCYCINQDTGEPQNECQPWQ